MLLLGLLLADDLRAWQGLHEGMLIEAADGDTERAIAWYEGLIAGLPDDDPSLGELNYWLAHARYTEGDAEGARRALRLAMEDPTVATEARALMGQIDAQELRVYRLPVSYDFSGGTGHWLHAWEYGDKGTLASATPPDAPADPALAWTTMVTEREDDAIRVFFESEIWSDGNLGGPEQIGFRIKSGAFEANLALYAEDPEGRRYAADGLIVARTDGWTNVRVLTRELVPLDSPNPKDRLRPGDVASVTLLDVTARQTSNRGPNTLYLDDLSIR